MTGEEFNQTASNLMNIAQATRDFFEKHGKIQEGRCEFFYANHKTTNVSILTMSFSILILF